MPSHVQLSVTPWTAAHQAPLSMELYRQKYGSGLPFPTPGDLPDPGIEPPSLMSLVLAGGVFTTEPAGKPLKHCGLNAVIRSLRVRKYVFMHDGLYFLNHKAGG